MEEKIALVTGGATGIGAACCKSLVEAGFKVGIHYNSSKNKAEDLAKLNKEFLYYSGRCIYH